MDKERFLETVEDHEMRIIMDDGVARNIVYKRPASHPHSFNRWFGLNTWSGHLCIYGDMGTYVFARTEDMFRFFRNDSLRINECYWHEKMQSESRFRGALEYKEELFDDAVREEIKRHLEARCLSLSDAKELWAEVKEDVLCAETEEEAYRCASNFRFKGEYVFQDFWEHQLRDYTDNFKWCLYAIVWGIQQYDEKVKKDPA